MVAERTTHTRQGRDGEGTSEPAASGEPQPVDGDTLTILGHDMGTPLTAITTAAELAMKVMESSAADSGGEHHADLMRCLSTVQRNAARLELLRDGLLNTISPEADRLTATPAPVLLRPRPEAPIALVATPPQVDLECDPSLTWWLQPSHLHQAILNLIRDRLSTRFTRLDTTTGLPDTGLELDVVGKLIAAKDGSVAFEPGPHGGSWFTVTLRGRVDQAATTTSPITAVRP